MLLKNSVFLWVCFLCQLFASLHLTQDQSCHLSRFLCWTKIKFQSGYDMRVLRNSTWKHQLCSIQTFTKQNPEFCFNNSMLVSPLSLPVEKCLLHVPGLGCSAHLGVCESQGLCVSHQMSANVSPHFSRAVALTLPSEAYYFIDAVMITQQLLEARMALQVLEYLVNYYQTSERN